MQVSGLHSSNIITAIFPSISLAFHDIFKIIYCSLINVLLVIPFKVWDDEWTGFLMCKCYISQNTVFFSLKTLLYFTHARRLAIDEEILNIHMFQHLSGKQGH